MWKKSDIATRNCDYLLKSIFFCGLTKFLFYLSKYFPIYFCNRILYFFPNFEWTFKNRRICFLYFGFIFLKHPNITVKKVYVLWIRIRMYWSFTYLDIKCIYVLYKDMDIGTFWVSELLENMPHNSISNSWWNKRFFLWDKCRGLAERDVPKIW